MARRCPAGRQQRLEHGHHRGVCVQRVLHLEGGEVSGHRARHHPIDLAVVNARKDMNSDVAALYVEALNEVTNIHWLRVAIGLQARIPGIIWMALYALVILGMIGIGYQTAIAGSRRTWAMLILALSFSLVLALIAELDRPASDLLPVTQQPLEDLQVWMAIDSGIR